MIDEPLTYREFRPGYTFGAIRMELAEEQRRAFENEGRRMFVTRHTVMGRWKQRKWESYQSYLKYFASAPSPKKTKRKP